MSELLDIASELERQARRLRAYATSSAGEDGKDEWPAWREAQQQRRRLRDPNWPPRGQLAAAVEERGGRVERLQFLLLAGDCGYTDGRSIGGFYSGRPPMFRDDGDDVVLTERGVAAARFWREHFGS
jgi:hypothetical protein